MRVVALYILKKQKQSNILCSAIDVSNLNYFQRAPAIQFLDFFAKTVANRIMKNTTIQITEKDYVIYAKSSGNLISIVFTDNEYCTRVACDLVNKILLDFIGKFQNYEKEIRWIELYDILKEYQKIEQVDKILKIQKDIDSTKMIMLESIDDILIRGEKLDDLVSKTDELSEQSKVFYKQSKKMNSCCSIM